MYCNCGTGPMLHEIGHPDCEYTDHHCDGCHEENLCTSHGGTVLVASPAAKDPCVFCHHTEPHTRFQGEQGANGCTAAECACGAWEGDDDEDGQSDSLPIRCVKCGAIGSLNIEMTKVNGEDFVKSTSVSDHFASISLCKKCK